MPQTRAPAAAVLTTDPSERNVANPLVGDGGLQMLKAIVRRPSTQKPRAHLSAVTRRSCCEVPAGGALSMSGGRVDDAERPVVVRQSGV
jgi:hypothetical protein